MIHDHAFLKDYVGKDSGKSLKRYDRQLNAIDRYQIDSFFRYAAPSFAQSIEVVLSYRSCSMI